MFIFILEIFSKSSKKRKITATTSSSVITTTTHTVIEEEHVDENIMNVEKTFKIYKRSSDFDNVYKNNIILNNQTNCLNQQIDALLERYVIQIMRGECTRFSLLSRLLVDDDNVKKNKLHVEFEDRKINFKPDDKATIYSKSSDSSSSDFLFTFGDYLLKKNEYDDFVTMSSLLFGYHFCYGRPISTITPFLSRYVTKDMIDEDVNDHDIDADWYIVSKCSSYAAKSVLIKDECNLGLINSKVVFADLLNENVKDKVVTMLKNSTQFVFTKHIAFVESTIPYKKKQTVCF